VAYRIRETEKELVFVNFVTIICGIGSPFEGEAAIGGCYLCSPQELYSSHSDGDATLRFLQWLM